MNQTKKKGVSPSQKFKQPPIPSQQIVPLGFVLKFDPPIIGLLYKRSPKDKKKKVYQIHLKNLIFHDDEVEITKLLFCEHPDFLDPDIIEPEQVLSLVSKLLQYKEMKMEEMAEFLEDCDEKQNETSNAFMYGQDNDPVPDQTETESNYLDDISRGEVDDEDDDDEIYKQMRLEELERLKQLEKKKSQVNKQGKLAAIKK